MKMIRGVTTSVAVLVGLALAGCGMAPKAEAPASGGEIAPGTVAPTSAPAPNADEAEPTTLADAERQLERARADLDRLALNEPSLARSEAAGAAPPPPAAAPSPVRSAPAEHEESRRADKAAADDGAAPATQAPAKEPNACETACKAFSSLTRASDAVCRLDTDGGKRCERARQIRADASQRVASCGCSK